MCCDVPRCALAPQLAPARGPRCLAGRENRTRNSGGGGGGEGAASGGGRPPGHVRSNRRGRRRLRGRYQISTGGPHRGGRRPEESGGTGGAPARPAAFPPRPFHPRGHQHGHGHGAAAEARACQTRSLPRADRSPIRARDRRVRALHGACDKGAKSSAIPAPLPSGAADAPPPPSPRSR